MSKTPKGLKAAQASVTKARTALKNATANLKRIKARETAARKLKSAQAAVKKLRARK